MLGTQLTPAQYLKRCAEVFDTLDVSQLEGLADVFAGDEPGGQRLVQVAAMHQEIGHAMAVLDRLAQWQGEGDLPGVVIAAGIAIYLTARNVPPVSRFRS